MKRFQVSLLSLLFACALVSISASFYAQGARKDHSIGIVEDDIDSVLFHVSITDIRDIRGQPGQPLIFNLLPRRIGFVNHHLSLIGLKSR